MLAFRSHFNVSEIVGGRSSSGRCVLFIFLGDDLLTGQDVEESLTSISATCLHSDGIALLLSHLGKLSKSDMYYISQYRYYNEMYNLREVISAKAFAAIIRVCCAMDINFQTYHKKKMMSSEPKR